MNEQAFKELIDQYITGRLSHENQSTFAMLLEKPEYQAMLEAELERSFMNDEFEGTETAERKARLNTLIFEKIAVRPQTPVHRVHFLKRSWARIAVAAAILLLIGSVVYYSWLKPVKQEGVASSMAPAANILPGGNKATLTLGDGSVIVLDNAANGALAQEGAMQVIKTQSGELVYSPAEALAKAGKHSPLTYNTLATPRGGQYQLVLPDGSKVWLNAASSIRYPATFTGTERRVEITGEAYFEVATVGLPPALPTSRDKLSGGGGAVRKKMPFIVASNGAEVKVLGTHFNVNTYAYEAAQRVTLLEGSVQVSQSTIDNRQSAKDNEWAAVLKPGEQAVLKPHSPLTINYSPDIEEVVAWKNGKFSFGETADIHSVMNQVADWYDVKVVFKGATNKHISGTISRNVNLGLLLQMLKTTGVADFKVEGKNVEVIMN